MKIPLLIKAPFVFNLPKKELPTGLPINWQLYLPAGEQQKYLFDEDNCFPYDTQVLMEDLTTKRISEIRKGEYVISHTGKKRKVTEIFKRDYNKEFVKIEISGLFEPIICTDNHPILTEEGWKEAQFLTKNDRVCVPTLSEFSKDITVKEIEKNIDFLWLLGLYLAEGNLGKDYKPKNINPKLKVNGTGNGRGTIHFSLHKNEIDIANKINKISKELFDTRFTLNLRNNSQCMMVRGSNVWLRDLLADLGGEYSYKKNLNARMMFLNPKIQLEIVKGWLDGDGHFNKEKRKIVGTTTSKKLVEQMQMILLRNKIGSSIYKMAAKGIRREYYQLAIYGTEINKLYDWKLEKTIADKFIKGFLLRKIKKIEKKKIYNYKHVYNIEVEKDNSYIVNTVAVHNCMSFSSTHTIATYLNYMLANGLLPADFLAFCQTNGYLVNNSFEFSVRFNAIMNKTDPNIGADFSQVWDAIADYGMIPMSMLSFSMAEAEMDTTEQATWNDYYNPADVTQAMKDLALQFNQFISIKYDWILSSGFLSGLWNGITGQTQTSILQGALLTTPVHIALYPCPSWNSGQVLPCGNSQPQHGVEAFNANNDTSINVFDQYVPFQKLLLTGYPVPYAVIPIITFKTKPIHTFSVNLAYGDVSAEVTWLQRCLAYLGYPALITGLYGTITASCMLSFQKANNIDPASENNFGPKSREAMNALFSSKVGV